MRIYKSCLDAVTDIARELQKCSTIIKGQTMQNKQITDNPEYNTREIQAFSFTILDTADKKLMPNLTLAWCEAEFQERIGQLNHHAIPSRRPTNPGEAYELRKNVWEEFLVNGKFDYTYSERMYWQIDAIIKELKHHPKTRQAIIDIHNNRTDLAKMGKDRIPCSLNYHLMLRDSALDMIYMMRSSDFITHFQNDLYLAMKLQQYISNQVPAVIGKFIFFCSSLHIYRKDWDELARY